jgi:molybdate transport system substrate-binding protein
MNPQTGGYTSMPGCVRRNDEPRNDKYRTMGRPYYLCDWAGYKFGAGAMRRKYGAERQHHDFGPTLPCRRLSAGDWPRVKLRFGTIGEIQKRVAAGEASDVIIVTDALIEKMVGEGLLVQETRSAIARVGIGVGVRESARKPDISTPETFRQTLLSAKSVAHPDPARGGVVGNYIIPMLERLGVAEAVKQKAVLGTGAHPLCEFVAKGEAELCVTQISEILAVKGITLAGPLPRGLQNVTTFAVARMKQSGATEAARAFVTFITRPSLRAKFAEGGLDFHED